MLKITLKIFLLLAAIHLSIVIASPHVANHLLKMKVKEIVRESHTRSERFIEEEILEFARARKIPLARSDLHVWRQSGKLQVWIDYEREVPIPYRPYEVYLQVAFPPNTQPPTLRSTR